MKRRNFIKNIGQLSAAPLVFNGLSLNPFATPSMLSLLNCEGIGDRALVVIFLKGGNDGINTIVPINQFDTYVANRPDIALPETGINGVIPLDSTLPIEDQVGLHPAMTAFKDMYDNGKARLVQSVGYPSPNQSHFKSTDLWLTGGDGTSANFNLDSGWIGRYLEAAFPGVAGNSTPQFPDPLGIQFGDSKPSLSFHDHSQNYTGVNLSGQNPANLFGLLNGLGTAPHSDVINSEYGTELQYIMSVENSLNAYGQRITDVYDNGNNSSTTYPDSYLAYQLKTVARLIKGGSGTKIFMIHKSGFDTHAGQVEADDTHTGHHAELLADIFDSVKAFNDDLGVLGIEDRVITGTFSEFGRRATQNGSLGTDHGTTAPLFLFGSGVNAGVSGTNPDLSNLTSNGNLIDGHQTDYRSVFKTLLQDWLAADATVITNADFDAHTKAPDLIDPSALADPSCYIPPQAISVPIELREFSAKVVAENKVQVEWSTLSEINHDFFEVERSADGIEFELLETVNGRGDSTSLRTYSLIDEEPLAGTSFYRLKSVDFTEEFSYSPIRSVTIKEKVVSHYKVYPNPAVFDTNVVLTSKVSADAELQLFALDGKMIASQSLKVKEGFNKFSMDVSNFSAGNYLLKVQSADLDLPVSKLIIGS